MQFPFWQSFLNDFTDIYQISGKPKEVFLNRFDLENWRKNDKDICESLEISLEVYKKHMSKVYEKFGGENGCSEIDPRSQGPGKFGKLLDWLRYIKYPEWLDRRNNKASDIRAFNYEAPVPLNSSFYIERPPIETDCYQTILQPGALIRIKAPRQMGKTSLLDRVLAYTSKQGCRWIRLNLFQVERTKFRDLEKFLRWFCTYVGDRLQTPLQLDDYWSEDRGSMTSCTHYFEALLKQEDNPLVLGLDGVDHIFQYADITQAFFYLLRSWHEEANNLAIWEQLRLVVVHCTEDYGRLDINHSPFNVGLPVELEEFNQPQVQNLVRRYQLNWEESQIQQLMKMVGGHPYLIQLALSFLKAHPQISVEELLTKAPTDAGIYSRHLRPLTLAIQEQPELLVALKQVISSEDSTQIGLTQGYKLHSMGLIKRQGNHVVPRCALYQQYFRERLKL